MKLFGIAVVSATIGLAVALGAVGRPDAARTQDVSGTAAEHGVTVAGQGSVKAAPDEAGVSFGVSTDGSTASGALRANAAEMTQVIAALKSAGIASAHIQTQSISISPRTSDDGGEIVGYTASNRVSVTIRDLDRVGGVIDAAVAAGANDLSGPSLTRSDADDLYAKALKAAIANARAKAETIAAAAGVELGKVTEVVEGGSAPPPVALDARTAGQAVPPTPIEPGTALVEASVTVTFSIS